MTEENRYNAPNNGEVFIDVPGNRLISDRCDNYSDMMIDDRRIVKTNYGNYSVISDHDVKLWQVQKIGMIKGLDKIDRCLTQVEESESSDTVIGDDHNDQLDMYLGLRSSNVIDKLKCIDMQNVCEFQLKGNATVEDMVTRNIDDGISQDEIESENYQYGAGFDSL